MTKTLEVGDRMRMSVALINRLHDHGGVSLTVEVVDIKDEGGEKVLVVKALNDGSNFNPVTHA